MYNSSAPPWSNRPNAPKYSHRAHLAEEAMFATTLIDMVSYGVIIMLFLQCMTTLLNPIKPRDGGTRWLLVAHTMAIFSFTTIYSTLDLSTQIISFVNNRGFPGSQVSQPGPLGYLRLITTKPISLIMNTPLVLVGWLADGLLLYRCHIIFAMNYRAIALPFLMYFASLATGILYIWQISHPFGTFWTDTSINFGVMYISISTSLNAILTLMIAIRLVMHNKMVQKSIGGLSPTNRLYKLIAVVFVESCALYTVSSIAYLGPWSQDSYISDYLYVIVSAAQVIAPFLITLRIANRTALTSDSIIGCASTIRFGIRGTSMEGDETAPDRGSALWTDGGGDTSDKASVEGGNEVEEVRI